MTGKVVLIAVDGSDHSYFALKWFAEQLAKPGDTVLLAHCVNLHNINLGTSAMVHTDAQVIGQALQKEEQHVQSIVKRMEQQMKALSLNGRIVRLSGDPGHAITKAALDQKADMIVTGCRGQGQIRRTIMGSVSSYVLHHAHVPVLVCRYDDH